MSNPASVDKLLSLLHQAKCDDHVAKWLVVEISPEMAEELLTCPAWQPPAADIQNRKMNTTTIARYAEAMRRGEWHLNYEPLIFSDKGVRLNGEHRLHAVVAAGVPLTTAVVVGAPAHTFSSMDTGRRRSTTDILTIAGVEDARRQGAVATMVSLYDKGFAFNGYSGFSANAEMLEFIERNATKLSAASAETDAYRRTTDLAKAVRPTVLATALYLSRESTIVSPEDIERIWKEFLSGHGIVANRGCFAARRYLMNAYVSRKLPPARTQLAALIKGFNAAYREEAIQTFRFKPDTDAFPHLIGRPPVGEVEAPTKA